MKKSIKTIGALAIMLITIFACKKEEDAKQVDERYSVAIKVESEKGGSENAIIIGTKAELEAALKKQDGGVYLKKIATNNNVFVVVDNIVPDQPADPHVLCWREINAYYSEHIDQWQQLANETCQNVLRCITCPNAGLGLFVMYDIAPNSIKCTIADAVAVQYAFSKFDFNDSQLESEAVAAHIQKR